MLVAFLTSAAGTVEVATTWILGWQQNVLGWLKYHWFCPRVILHSRNRTATCPLVFLFIASAIQGWICCVDFDVRSSSSRNNFFYYGKSWNGKISIFKSNFCLPSAGGSVQPELGYGIENQNLGPISILILELKLFLPNIFLNLHSYWHKVFSTYEIVSLFKF